MTTAVSHNPPAAPVKSQANVAGRVLKISTLEIPQPGTWKELEHVVGCLPACGLLRIRLSDAHARDIDVEHAIDVLARVADMADEKRTTIFVDGIEIPLLRCFQLAGLSQRMFFLSV